MPDLSWILVLGSLALAAIFAMGVGVPGWRPSGIRGAVIRWAHPLVWILLAGMFAALAVGTAAASLVQPLGLGALVLYLVYLVTLFGSAKRR